MQESGALSSRVSVSSPSHITVTVKNEQVTASADGGSSRKSVSNTSEEMVSLRLTEKNVR